MSGAAYLKVTAPHRSSQSSADLYPIPKSCIDPEKLSFFFIKGLVTVIHDGIKIEIHNFPSRPRISKLEISAAKWKTSAFTPLL